AEQGQQRCFAGAGRAGEDHQLARHDLHVVVEQHLRARLAGAEVVVDALDADEGLARRWIEWGSALHQNTSAGSACCTLRSASSPEATHITIVMSSVASTCGTDISIGRPVQPAHSS